MNNTLSDLYRTITKTSGNPPSTLRVEGIVSNIQVLGDGLVEMTLLVEDYPSCDAVCQTETLFENALGIPEVRLCLHTTEQSDADVLPYLPWAFRHMEKTDFFMTAFLKTADFEQVSADSVRFTMNTGSEDVLDKPVDRMLSEFFKQTMRRSITFSQRSAVQNFDEAMQNSVKEVSDIANKKRERMELPSGGRQGGGSNKTPDPSNRKKGQGGEDTHGPAKLGANPQPQAIPSVMNGQPKKKGAEYKKIKQPAGVIWGKINPELPVVPMSTLSNETGPATIEGTVFGMESRPVGSGTKVLMKFCLTDRTNSIRCFAFMKPEEAADFEEEYKKAFLRICAEVGYDVQYEKDLVARVIGIQIATPPKKKTDSAADKRVELHCHTKMSSKDSVCDVSDIVGLAVHYGHEAVAITDHGVVQAFPDARSAQLDARKKGKSIKIIYGIECYLVDDGPCLAYPCGDDSFETGFVAIHLETYGEDPAAGHVQKIEAVRFDRDASGRYRPAEKFIRPFPSESESPAREKEPLSLETFAEFERFIGGRPVAAHNILRQTAFLRYEGFRTESEQDPRIKFFQTAIDTQKIARTLYPDMEDHSEESLAARFGFGQEGAPDTSPAMLAGRFLDIVLSSNNIQTAQELNRLSGSSRSDALLTDAKNQYHCILLAKDAVGLYGLYRLVSESHLHFIYKERPRITRSLLEFFRSGLLFGSACEAGELFMGTMALYDQCGMDYETARQALSASPLPDIARFYDYLEIQPPGNNRFMLRTAERKGQIIPAKYRSEDDLKNLNRLVVDLGRMIQKPVCATCDVHFLQPQDAIYREIMQTDMGYSDAQLQPPLFFRTTEEMLAEFDDLGDDAAREVVVENPKAIAAQITADMKPFPEGSFPPVIATAAHDIEEFTWAAAKSMYEKDGALPEIVRTRIKKELKSIIGNGFAIMYYIAYKLVKKSNDDGYIVGSRGSVGSSLVATLCGITEVNPLAPHYYCGKCRYSEFDFSGKYGSGYDMPEKACPECGDRLIREGQDIPFETFLGFEGEKQPDIDLNFSGEYQPTAHKFIEEMFGSSHTFRAGTISGYAEKNAISMVLKFNSSKDIPVTKAETLRLANGLIGVKRTTGQHPGGIVVVPKERDVYDFTPVQCPADKTEIGIVTTHFDFNSLHDTILKLDILGHDDPTMLKVLGDITGVDVRTIPVPDDEVMKLFLSNEPLKLEKSGSTDNGTLGLPELGTFMARGMIKDTRPTRFYDLVQLMGLSHGKDVWKGNAQDLIRSGTCTISEVIGCRDGIMTSLMHWGLPPKSAFTIMEKVRKGKGLSEDQENLMKEHRVPDWYIESCKKIKYMFPKAHAAAYTISALRIAWFKVYHPAEYYCAFFTVRADEFDSRLMCRGYESVKHYREKLYSSFREKDKIVLKILGKEEEISVDKAQNMYYILELIEEMYCRGIEFLPVDIYESEATRFKKVSGNKIRPPLNTLPNLSETVANNILEARAGVEKFLSREDFARRAGIGESLMTLLADQGCLDGMPETTQIDLFSLLSPKE